MCYTGWVPFKDPEAQKAYNREYRRKNGDRLRAYDRARMADPERRRRHTETYRAWLERNPNYKAEYSRRYNEKNRALLRQKQWAARLARYSISEEVFFALWFRCRGMCSTCGAQLDGGKSTAIDHCHVQGAVRGLLCSTCNTALGMARDSPQLLRSLQHYLEWS